MVFTIQEKCSCRSWCSIVLPCLGKFSLSFFRCRWEEYSSFPFCGCWVANTEKSVPWPHSLRWTPAPCSKHIPQFCKHERNCEMPTPVLSSLLVLAQNCQQCRDVSTSPALFGYFVYGSCLTEVAGSQNVACCVHKIGSFA